MQKAFLKLTIAILFLLPMYVFAQGNWEKQVRYYLDIPINIQPLNLPVPVKGSDNKWHLSYTLLITNNSFSHLTLTSATVTDKRSNRTLTIYGKKELEEYDRYRTLMPTPRLSTLPNNRLPDSISSGRTAVLLFWIEADDLNSIPDSLAHIMIFKKNYLTNVLKDSIYDKDSNMVLKNYAIRVNKQQPLVISPPLRGKGWYCGNGPGYNTDHQYLSIRNGKMRMPQRFGIDFKKVDKDFNSLPNPFPDTINNRMFYGYGERVYAVADAVVTDVKDWIPENIPQADGSFKPAVPIRDETNPGNMITLKMGNGYYAFYAHLQPQSITVKKGDRVKRGQFLGLLGNSGNSTGPHLHFHIGNENSLNGGEGLPFVFDTFSNNGKKYSKVIPMNGNIVDF